MNATIRLFSLAALGALSVLSAAAHADEAPAPALKPPPGMSREILSRTDVPNSNHEVVVMALNVPPNVTVGRHTHPGAVTGYVVEGEYTMIVDGEAPKLLKAGEHLSLPVGVAHDERTGATAAKLLVIFTVEKGKPLTTPLK